MAGTYRITFNANGGSNAPGAITGSTNEMVTADGTKYYANVTLPSGKPSRTYYTFSGWGGSSGSTSASWQAGGTYTVNTTLSAFVTTLYAVWAHQTAYVYYNANGGSGAPSTQSHWAGYSITLSATVPTRSGYNFKGWATSPTATVKQYDPNTSYPLYTTVTLYAVWEVAASTLTVSNGTLGTALSIGITRNNNSYTDTITYQFGSATGTIATKTSSNSVSWTPATTLASEIPNSSTGICVLTCTTYNGNTAIGTSTKQITLTVPTSLAPTVSVSYADTVATPISWGVFVQSRSKLAFTITATGQESATIATYQATVNGASYTSATFTTDVLLYSGTNTYTVTVTDSRGLQTTSTGTFSVEAYGNPSVTLTSCDRNDSDDSQVDIVFDFAVASVSNNNDANYAIDHKLKSSNVWISGTVTSLGAYSGTITDSVANLDGGDEWDIRIRVIDSFQTASVQSEVGVSGNILLNSRHLGALGILMKSQAQNQLDVGKQSVFHEPVKEMYGSIVGNHSVSGNYAKVLTFSTDVQMSNNLLPPMADGTYSGNGAQVIVSGGIATLSGTTTASGNAFNIPLTQSVVIPDDSYLHCMNSVANGSLAPSLELSTDAGNTSIAPSFSPANRIYTIPSNRFGVTVDRIRFYIGNNVTLSGTYSPMICTTSTAIPYEPYVDASNLNVSEPITLEYANTGYTSPVTLTINFNRDYTLASFTKDASADAYLVNSAAGTWDLYIGKSSASDSVEILDFHNPWSNTDMTVTWGTTSISTLPTGYVEASPTNTRIYENSNSVSPSSGSWKTASSIALTPGVWIVSGFAQFNSNTTGIRAIVLSTSQDDSNATRGMSSDRRVATTGSSSTTCHFVDIYEVSSSTTYYLNAYQTSGSALTIYGRIYAIKIV